MKIIYTWMKFYEDERLIESVMNELQQRANIPLKVELPMILFQPIERFKQFVKQTAPEQGRKLWEDR